MGLAAGIYCKVCLYSPPHAQCSYAQQTSAVILSMCVQGPCSPFSIRPGMSVLTTSVVCCDIVSDADCRVLAGQRPVGPGGATQLPEGCTVRDHRFLQGELKL